MNSPPSVVLPIIFSFFFFYNGKGCDDNNFVSLPVVDENGKKERKERKPLLSLVIGDKKSF